MSNLRCVFLDFDGTIFHSERVHQMATSRVIEEYTGEKVDIDELRAYVGLPYYDRLEHMLAMRGVADEELLEGLEKKATTILEEHLDLKHMLVPGVVELIHALAQAEIKLAVVSSSPRARIETDLRAVGLLEYIQKITAVEDVTCRKPHPEPYEKTLEYFGVTAREVIAFEDSPTGVESATLAGIPVIALLTTFEEVDLARAQKTIHDYTELDITDRLSLL